MKLRRYSELIKLPTYAERLKYLEVLKPIGVQTFGRDRYLNQMLYQSREWKRFRDTIITRDSDGDHVLDLGDPKCIIYGKVIVHHIVPLTVEMIESRSQYIFDPEFVICCSVETHEAIHYTNKRVLTRDYVPRRPNDTCPWKM